MHTEGMHNPKLSVSRVSFVELRFAIRLAALFIYFFFSPLATDGLWSETSKNPICCSCPSLCPWFLSSATCSRSDATVWKFCPNNKEWCSTREESSFKRDKYKIHTNEKVGTQLRYTISFSRPTNPSGRRHPRQTNRPRQRSPQTAGKCGSYRLERTVISRLISKINGINTTIDVVARNNPTVPPFCANQYDHSLEILNPC